ncbi:putative leader peptide [Pseudonocardia sp. Cha107L01]
MSGYRKSARPVALSPGEALTRRRHVDLLRVASSGCR